jgi:LruC domain-containing protein
MFILNENNYLWIFHMTIKINHMKTNQRVEFVSGGLICIILAFLIIVLPGCRKHTDNGNEIPTKFTDLKINQAFEFESFVDLNVTVLVTNPSQNFKDVIQIYEGDPATTGKVMKTGAVDDNGQFSLIVRVPTRLKELYFGKITPTGNNQYGMAPISGTSLTYIFGKSGGALKSGDELTGNDCNSGCTTTISTPGTYTKTVNSGQTLCVASGITVTFTSLTINAGGKVRICGTATINAISGTGILIVSPSGNTKIPALNLYGTFENYGTLNFAVAGTNKTFNLMNGAVLHNWGTLTISNSLNVKGSLINEGPMTVVETLATQTNGTIDNRCSLFINSNKSNALNITTGNVTTPGLKNSGYIKVTGQVQFPAGSYVRFELQSLVECQAFAINGTLNGPSSQGSQIHSTSSTKSQMAASSYIDGYVDLWSAAGFNPNLGFKGPNVTLHNPGYTIPAPSCTTPVPPTITSSLTAAGLVGQPITPYVITATGTEPITYNATNLPAGLIFNASTHTISGTPTTAGTTNITLVADNLVGTDTKTLVFTVTTPASPPIITSPLTDQATVNQPYSYTVTATGTTPITYTATNLPSGLSFDPGTHMITGTPAVTGTFNIPLTATNSAGTDSKTLVLTIGAPPAITSPLTASGTVGQQFTYQITATGNTPITFNATNLPAGLYFSGNTITGTPQSEGTTNVTLTATNAFGNDLKILQIVIGAAPTPPVITSSLSASGTVNQPFSYTITATGTEPITFNATNLPAGLTFSGNTISGIPTSPGVTNVTLTATNSAGTDTKTLVITIIPSGGPTDTDGDGVPDNIDAYPTDPTRAFNSWYPNETDYASYAFEDLWPAYGDYDCNDLVMNFNYKIVTNAQNKVVDWIAKFKIKAAGATLDNGFGISFNTLPSYVESVTGCIKLGNSVTIDPKGYEAGHTNNLVIIVVDAVQTLLGCGIANTIHGGCTVQTQVQTVTIHFSTPQADIGTPPYNPFIFINQDRGKEVHLKDHLPTELVNPIWFGSMDDGSDPAKGWYYRSKTALPWAMEIPVDFDYPVEFVDILQAYLHFAEWAQSSGAVYTDWYMDKPGYRNPANIY